MDKKTYFSGEKEDEKKGTVIRKLFAHVSEKTPRLCKTFCNIVKKVLRKVSIGKNGGGFVLAEKSLYVELWHKEIPLPIKDKDLKKI